MGEDDENHKRPTAALTDSELTERELKFFSPVGKQLVTTATDTQPAVQNKNKSAEEAFLATRRGEVWKQKPSEALMQATRVGF